MLRFLTAAILFVPPAGPVPPVGTVAVDLVAASGAGCSADETAMLVSPDNRALTVAYGRFLARTGKGSAPLDFRKNCQLTVQIDGPDGYGWAVERVEHRGFAHLQTGASATLRSEYHVHGIWYRGSAHHNFAGPMEDVWGRTDRQGDGPPAFVGCGEPRYLYLSTMLRVLGGPSDKAGSTVSFVGFDDNGSMSSVYHLVWRRC